MKLAVIIPALNEEASIGSTLDGIPGGLASQLIVVDNGSTDRTVEVARDAGATVISEPRRGYGHACLTGLARLENEIEAVAFLDADGSDDATQLVGMLEQLETSGADFVLTARVMDDARSHLTIPQRFGNWLACSLIAMIWGKRYRDMGPMRMLRRDALERPSNSVTKWAR